MCASIRFWKFRLLNQNPKSYGRAKKYALLKYSAQIPLLRSDLLRMTII